ncbi:HlyD family efflux transporter periplasmic adaptor subunit [Magnetospirillum sp. 15-1]|uniref:efflux RND transporter periplasmic adaptor subunit n=1 Tax=Magnetospirillum sp. 15-1 TaxID=1979370 RepID=UPI000BBC9D8A|nr:HlyD family efflux transporter periplasmic adaptor subunit [Magnetospirillum sp. 15-1]
MSDILLQLLELESRILRAARPVEVAFLAVDMAFSLIPYRQAALWSPVSGMAALSGVAAMEDGSPYGLWLDQVFRALADRDAPTVITAADLPAALAEPWGDWLPVHALVLPMGGEILLYARDEAFAPNEVALLAHLAALTGVARRALVPKSWAIRLPKSHRVKWLAAAGLLVGLFPVTGSVLAPADAVPAHPVMIRAPLDGVVDRIAVQPNERVAEGDRLFDLDGTALSGKLDVARSQWATAEAEYRQAAQAMVFDPKAKAQIAILSGKAEEKAAEVRLLDSQLARIAVKAPRPGIAVFDDPSDWIGKPVAMGEKVMAIADETDTEVEAWVAAADMGDVQPGARLTLFLNTAPLSPLRATVRSVAYEAAARPDATIAHRVRAGLAEGEAKPRLGLKGTARIDGDRVPLVWWLFRKPLATIRQFVGV